MFWRVQLPLALPEIVLGINQTVLLALSMIIIAAMIGTRDLGQEVFIALAKADAGRGIVAGLAVAFIGIVADRLIGGASAKSRARLTGALSVTAAGNSRVGRVPWMRRFNGAAAACRSGAGRSGRATVPLKGGITNINFVVEDAGRKFVVRIGGDIEVHGIVSQKRARGEPRGACGRGRAGSRLRRARRARARLYRGADVRAGGRQKPE